MADSRHIRRTAAAARANHLSWALFSWALSCGPGRRRYTHRATGGARLALVLATIVFATHAIAPPNVVADDLQWNRTDGGSFGTFSNWTPGLVPNGADVAVFDLGNASTYTVNFFANRGSDLLQANSGDITFNLAGSTYQVTNDVVVAELAGDTAILRINGGTLDSGSGSIGFFPFADGRVVVNGAASDWDMSGSLTVAEFGDGVLDITGAGSVTSGNASLALSGGATGTVNVTGANSTFDVVGNLTVGEFATGNLNIMTGGHVTAGDLIFGTITGATGNATISGAAAMLTSNGPATFGDFGNAMLNINSGGKMVTAGATIGFDGTGVVTVDGGSSNWSNSGALSVAEFGQGTLNVTGGATVTNASAALAGATDAIANVLVSGFGSKWTTAGNLAVGGSSFSPGGQATVAVQSNAQVIVTGTLRVWEDGELNISGGFTTAAEVKLIGGLLSGSGIIAGKLTNAGTVSPGQSPGALSIIGNYEQAANGLLEIEIAETNVNLFDRLDVSGTATLDGTLAVDLISGFEPDFGDEFQILTANARVGTFATITGLDTIAGMYLAPIFESDGLRLVAALPGDANLDGVVNALDVNILSLHWLLTSATYADGDLNGDHVVNALDANILSLNFLTSIPATSVPEPTTLTLLASAFCAIGFRRTRRRSRAVARNQRRPIPSS